MTVLSDPQDQLSDGDGVTVAFPYAGRNANLEDIKCVIFAADGTPRIPTFTVTGDEMGATVSISSGAPAVGEKVLRYRETELRQKVNYEAGNFPSATHERNADKLVMAAQERKAVEARSLRMERGSADIPEIKVFEEADRTLVSLPGGGFGQGPSSSEISSAQGYSESARDDAQIATEQAEIATTAALPDTMLFFVSQDETSATFVTAQRAIISDPGPSPYPSIIIEVP